MTIRINPKDVWDFYMGNMYRLKYEDYIIAEEPGDVSVVICVDVAYDLVIMVQFGGKTYSISKPSSKDECEKMVQQIYEKYDIQSHEIFEREDQLKLAFYDFMVAVVEDEDLIYDGGFDEFLGEIMEETLTNIALYGFPVRRPTYVEDENGDEALVEYPYESEETCKV